MNKNKISVNQFEKIYKSFSDNSDISTIKYKISDDEEIKIEVKYLLSLNEVSSFVNNVIEGCFNDNEYYPSMKNFNIIVNAIKFYTNLTLPTNTNNIYDYSYKTNILENIENGCNPIQYKEIMKAINEGIEFRKQEIIQSCTSNEIFTNINSVVNEFKNLFNSKDMKLILSKLLENNGIDLNNTDIKSILGKLFLSNKSKEKDNVVSIGSDK
jgi:hypothetical protein